MEIDTLSIINISRCKYKVQSKVSRHCHNFYHLLYVTGGDGIIRVQDVDHDPIENDIFLIPPWIYHEMYSDPVHPLHTIEVKFICGNASMESSLQRLPIKIEQAGRDLRVILESMIDEAVGKKHYYKLLLASMLLEFLFRMMRNQEYRESAHSGEGAEDGRTSDAAAALTIAVSDESDDDLAGRLRQYLHQHYTDKITLTGLSRHFMVSAVHLNRAFRKKYGVAPIQYLNHWRIRMAKELLAYTDLSVTEISEKVGFQSVHYLSRFFTQKERIPPYLFRQKIKESIYVTVEEKYEMVDAKVNVKPFPLA